MEQNQSLNILKAIAAILVITIHAPMDGAIGQMIIAIARSGVALFFLISGYYMYSANLEDTRKRAKKKLLRTLRMALWAYSFYVFWGVFVRFTGTGMSSVKSWFAELFTVKKFFDVLVLQVDVVAGHLWFLNALIVCYLVALIWEDKIYKMSSLYIATILLVIHFIISRIIPLCLGISVSMSYYRNGWLYGIPFFLLGVILRTRHGINWDDRLLVILMILSLGCLGIERLVTGYHQIYICNFILLLSSFQLCVQHPKCNYIKSLQKIGSSYFNRMYIFQWAVINVVDKIYKITDTRKGTLFYLLVCIAGTISIAVIFDNGIKWLKKIR